MGIFSSESYGNNSNIRIIVIVTILIIRKTFALTVHVEFELSVGVHAHVYPFVRAGLHLFEVNDVVPGGPVPVRVEMEIVARETCGTVKNILLNGPRQ